MGERNAGGGDKVRVAEGLCGVHGQLFAGSFGARLHQNQREHHRVTTFEEEYIAFLRRHDIEFEHRWLFEAEHHG